MPYFYITQDVMPIKTKNNTKFGEKEIAGNSTGPAERQRDTSPSDNEKDVCNGKNI